MKAIWTKYLGPTNFRGSRVKAVAENANGFGAEIGATVEYDDALSVEANHDSAALALCEKMGWPGDLMRGGRPDGMGNVYTFAAECNRVSNPTPSYAEQDKARKALADAARKVAP